MQSYVQFFESRLRTLNHLIDSAVAFYEGDSSSLMDLRLIEDMFPLGTQIAYTCNQPYNFCCWVEGKLQDNLSPELISFSDAKRLVNETLAGLNDLTTNEDLLVKSKRMEFGGGRYADFSGVEYVNDFLIPNFYFHLTTTYNILRREGVPIGKRDFMQHLLPVVKTEAS